MNVISKHVVLLSVGGLLHFCWFERELEFLLASMVLGNTGALELC
jgi:hypothetical protein